MIWFKRYLIIIIGIRCNFDHSYFFLSSLISWLNSLSSLLIRFSGESYSKTWPWPRTKTLSLLMIVLILWAITSIVASLNLSFIRFWIYYSVTTSIFAVASSKMTNFDFLRIALQMHKSCRSPELKFDPFSEMSCSNPFGLLSIRVYSWASLINYKISSSLALFSGSKLNLRVPVNIVGSWGMRVILSLKVSIFISEISRPSTSIEPSNSSTILLIAKQIVLLPAPVLPTTPIFSPYWT